MTIETMSGFLDNQNPVEKKKRFNNKEEASGMSRRNFLRLGLAGALGTVIANQGIKSSIWKKTFDLLQDRSDEILEKKKKVCGENKEIKEEAVDSLEGEEDNSSEDIEKNRNKSEAERTCDSYLEAYNELSSQGKYFPEKLFPKDLLMAQQFQESKYDKDARSSADAVGVMQVTDNAVMDVGGHKSIRSEKQDRGNDKEIKKARVRKVRREREGYLYRLNKKGLCSVEVPKSLSEQEVDKVMELMVVPDYCRSVGKLYLMQLWDKEDGYGIGRKHFENGDIEKAQDEILACYNAGARRIKGKPKEKWLKEPRDYVEKIRKYRKMIQEITDSSERKLTSMEILKILGEVYVVRNDEKRREKINNKVAVL